MPMRRSTAPAPEAARCPMPPSTPPWQSATTRSGSTATPPPRRCCSPATSCSGRRRRHRASRCFRSRRRRPPHRHACPCRSPAGGTRRAGRGRRRGASVAACSRHMPPAAWPSSRDYRRGVAIGSARGLNARFVSQPRAPQVAGLPALSTGMDRAKCAAVRRSLVAAALALAVCPTAWAGDPVPSFKYLVTGNGQGFSVFDVNANAVKQFLERPYRYLKANPSTPDGDGIVRRSLVFDTYFGVKAGGTSAGLGGRAPSVGGYVDESYMIRSEQSVGGVDTESFFVAPFGYPGNGLVMLLKITNTSNAAVPVTAYAIHNFKMGTASDPDAPGAAGESVTWDGTAATAPGPGGGAKEYVPLGGAEATTCNANAYTTVQGGGSLTTQSPCSGTDIKNAFQKNLGTLAPGASAWWGVAVLFAAGGSAQPATTAWNAFLAGQTPDALYASILAEVEAYRAAPAPGLNATETKVWRQAEIV